MNNHVVISSDLKEIKLDTFQADNDVHIFGPFLTKEDAEEWVDDNLSHKYWVVYPVKLINFPPSNAGDPFS